MHSWIVSHTHTHTPHFFPPRYKREWAQVAVRHSPTGNSGQVKNSLLACHSTHTHTHLHSVLSVWEEEQNEMPWADARPVVCAAHRSLCVSIRLSDGLSSAAEATCQWLDVLSCFEPWSRSRICLCVCACAHARSCDIYPVVAGWLEWISLLSIYFEPGCYLWVFWPLFRRPSCAEARTSCQLAANSPQSGRRATAAVAATARVNRSLSWCFQHTLCVCSAHSAASDKVCCFTLHQS